MDSVSVLESIPDSVLHELIQDHVARFFGEELVCKLQSELGVSVCLNQVEKYEQIRVLDQAIRERNLELCLKILSQSQRDAGLECERSNLRFMLQRIRFLEILAKESPVDALHFARQELIEFVDTQSNGNSKRVFDDSNLEGIGELMALLVAPDRIIQIECNSSAIECKWKEIEPLIHSFASSVCGLAANSPLRVL